MSDLGNIQFNLPKNQSNVIKVIGVGGGGSNAINHMFKQGIKGVDFVVCNTDAQALQNSPVPNKIQLGVNLTEGLGAGANPEVGQQSAIESVAEIEKMLDTNTKMVFITAGMGGGTGTGAAPVIAQLAKEREILTVGIVTIPFQFEGKNRSEQAMQGVEKLRKQVDSLIVVNNNKLREVYGNLGFKAGFSKADEVLATAARGIAEVISQHYIQNIDLRDAKTVLANSGTAIMGSAIASGKDRAKEAIVSALDSPLLNDNKIAGAQNVLLLIVSGTSETAEITLDEIGEINEYIQNEAGYSANIIMGVGEDDTLEESVSVTVIATGFNVDQQAGIINTEPQRIIHTLEDEQKVVQNLSSKEVQNIEVNQPVFESKTEEQELPKAEVPTTEEKVIFTLEEEKEVIEETVSNFEIEEKSPEMDLIPTTDFLKDIDVTYEVVSPEVAPSFEIISPEVKEIEVNEPEFVVEDEFNYSLDLFENTNKVEETQNKTVFELSDDAKEIEVKDPINVVPVTEVSKEGVIKYSLDDSFEENKKVEAKTEVKEPVDGELNFEVKKTEQPKFEKADNLENASPFEMTIEETLKARAEERKRKMKDFNYKFNNSSSRIDEFEKVPAYKRMGVDVTSTPEENKQSRTTLGTDSNDDLQLRSNNSFLHDNVD